MTPQEACNLKQAPPILPQEALRQMAFMCRSSDHPDVKHLGTLTQGCKEKAVRFAGRVFIVHYFPKKRRVQVLSEVPADTYVFPLSKRLYHKVHTKQRLKERFNIDATDNDLKTISAMCSTRYEHIVIKKRPGQSKNYIRFQGLDMVAVYAENSDSIVTVMPPSFLSEQEKDFIYNRKRTRYKQLLKHAKETLYER